MENFSQGLLGTGITVLDMGIVPTPANYFSMFHFDVDGAVQITGSHNPPEFNGFKLSYKQGAFYGDQIKTLLGLIKTRNFETGDGKIEKVDIMKPYQLMLKEKIHLDKPMNAVIDCGNAVGCLTAPQIFNEVGIETTELFCDVDGTFPNHHPDPTEDHNLLDLVAEIKSGNYDFGVAYDGDADRVVAVDENGGIIRSDILMVLFLPEVIKNPGDTIVYDVKCSQALEDMILKYGGKPVMWKTGHSLIKDKMIELDVNFAGEMSGHIFFNDRWFGFDDGIYSAARLLEIIAKHDISSDELFSLIPDSLNTPELKVFLPEEIKFSFMEKLTKHADFNNGKIITLDGLRVEFEHGVVFEALTNPHPCSNSTRSPSKVIIFPLLKSACLVSFSIKENFISSGKNTLSSGVFKLSGIRLNNSSLEISCLAIISNNLAAEYIPSSKPNHRSLKKICPLISPASRAFSSFILAFINECPVAAIIGIPPAS
jgi:phosphomannomutase/phosphoglucomutase